MDCIIVQIHCICRCNLILFFVVRKFISIYKSLQWCPSELGHAPNDSSSINKRISSSLFLHLYFSLSLSVDRWQQLRLILWWLEEWLEMCWTCTSPLPTCQSTLAPNTSLTAARSNPPSQSTLPKSTSPATLMSFTPSYIYLFILSLISIYVQSPLQTYLWIYTRMRYMFSLPLVQWSWLYQPTGTCIHSLIYAGIFTEFSVHGFFGVRHGLAKYWTTI